MFDKRVAAHGKNIATATVYRFILADSISIVWINIGWSWSRGRTKKGDFSKR